ncbi:MAG: YdeI/OmpD-associated family protein [Ilyomonas sp.]
MPSTDPRIDAYIDKAADFAKPVLKHFREVVHKACPEVEETIKWGFPHFDYKGIMCSIAAFKNHCAINLWKASLMKDPEGILQVTERDAMGNFNKVTSLKDLPSDKILIAYIKEAARLNEENVKVVKAKPQPRKEPETPAELITALTKNKKAKASFEAFSPSQRREYIEWINEAKTDATKNKRIKTTVEWAAEGKSRNWKYGRKDA